MKGVLTRIQSNEVQTLGFLDLYGGTNHLFRCRTLELPDRQNKRNESRIPEGVYETEINTSPTLGRTFAVKDVPGRSDILIHAGNFYTNIRGCILVGSDFIDINADGQADVTNSKATLRRLIEVALLGFELRIVDNDK